MKSSGRVKIARETTIKPISRSNARRGCRVTRHRIDDKPAEQVGILEAFEE
jgi:hypothetical protein